MSGVDALLAELTACAMVGAIPAAYMLTNAAAHALLRAAPMLLYRARRRPVPLVGYPPIS